MNVLVKPILTEQSMKQAEEGKFTFEVLVDATKGQIAETIASTFGVVVKKVWTLKSGGKTHRFGRTFKKLPGKKKAIVLLEKGQTIEFFETKQKGKKGGKSK